MIEKSSKGVLDIFRIFLTLTVFFSTPFARTKQKIATWRGVILCVKIFLVISYIYRKTKKVENFKFVLRTPKNIYLLSPHAPIQSLLFTRHSYISETAITKFPIHRVLSPFKLHRRRYIYRNPVMIERIHSMLYFLVIFFQNEKFQF